MSKRRMREIEKEQKCVNPECEYLNKVGSVVKNGKSGKNQYYRCRACDKRFSETYGTIFEGKKIAAEEIIQVLNGLAEGNSIRGSSRIFKHSKDTIINWLIQAGKHCEKFEELMVKKFKFNQVQIDELWTFIEKKTTHQVARKEKKKKSKN